MAIYNTIGDNYNQTRKADAFIIDQIKQLLLPKKGLFYLDIGCGTGNYTIALAELGVNIQGLDPSATMLSQARSKNDNISWTIGAAESLPFESDHFSGALATLTIHHWQNLQQSFKEIYRVLKPGSDLVIFTATVEQMQNYWLTYYFPVMMQRSIRQMPTLKAITDAACNAGFEPPLETPYTIKDDLQDLFLYSGKDNPSFYLNPGIRQNISSFSNLANEEEVNNGITKLAADIQNGNFETVKSSFDADIGDYLFLKIHKP